MSIRDCPCSGYIVPVATLKSLLPGQKHDLFNKLLEDWETDDIETLLADCLPEGLPTFSLYQPSAEDSLDESMEEGVLYAVFDEEALYVKTPTSEHEKLNLLGVMPVKAHWSIWG